MHIRKFLKVKDPQVTMRFNTKSWLSMTWMMQGTPMTNRSPPGVGMYDWYI